VLNAEPDNDQLLVRRAQQGERDAFAVLVGRHHRSVYWIVQGILQNQADSEEILQETFLKALAHIQDFRGDSQFRTWLIQIAINEARMRRRKYRTGLHDSLDEEREGESTPRPRELTDWCPNPEQQLAKQELSELVQKAIRALPKRYREVFVSTDVQHLSNDEVAGLLEISVSAAKTRILRARLMMREYLAPYLKMRWHDRLLARVTRGGR
jgi:RNA polymerase sigma-70 factor (ECF subfamily)